jgi:hypothetical protein
MYIALKILAIFLTAIIMGLALAHALELPGKLRLGKEQYLAVQSIYYPGFTIAGEVSEVGGILVVLALMVITPRNAAQFLPIAGALAALVVMQVIFWLMTQPVNKIWVERIALAHSAQRFFSSGDVGTKADWTVLRKQWEYSHIMRAVAAMLGLFLLTLALAL